MLKKNFTSQSPFCMWKHSPHNLEELQLMLHHLGIRVCKEKGHLYYADHFNPINVKYDLVFVRHGETFGNCGQTTSTGSIDYELVELDQRDTDKRIYQGDVDADINQLTEQGKKQALMAADKLKVDFLDQGWEPDIILVSPLTRAKDTAIPFVSQNKFEDRCLIHEGIKEMSFGSWDNRRVCDMPEEDPCHLFYRQQHALIKHSGLRGNEFPGTENFCEVLLRAYKVLMDLNTKYEKKKILMFSHSMFGAACCILLGKGQKIENDSYLAFDGKRSDNTYYTIPNATPFILSSEAKKISHKLRV